MYGGEGGLEAESQLGLPTHRRIVAAIQEGTSFIMTLLILPNRAMLIVFASMMTYFSFGYYR